MSKVVFLGEQTRRKQAPDITELLVAKVVSLPSP